MGKFDRRNSQKMSRLDGQRKKKERAKRRAEAVRQARQSGSKTSQSKS